ncbi:hypothetical protein ABT075_21840 [Streptomyces sp. NPDC002677]|uniref:lactate/malate family dehydrogenase n=1 Tax=Streptomyces sp. NPDC002677 TaxID=3154774 RepID=UPI003328F413
MTGRTGKASVVGAGACGSAIAQRLAEYDVFATIALTDAIPGRAEGVALDLAQSRTLVGFDTDVVGRTITADGAGCDVLASSDVVVLTAGVPRREGVGRNERAEATAAIVESNAHWIAEHAPGAVVVVISNPMEEMTALTRQVTGFPHQRVFGMGNLLDSARLASFIAAETGAPASAVRALTCGPGGADMVAVESACTVGGRAAREMLPAGVFDRLVARTRTGGAEVADLLRTGSAWFAPSAAVARLVRAVHLDTREVLPVCAWLTGECGAGYLGVTAELGAGGVRRVVLPPLTAEQTRALVTPVNGPSLSASWEKEC